MQDAESDGWTHVATKGKKKHSSSRQPNTPPSTHRNPPSRNIDPMKVRHDFDKKMGSWRASSCRKSILLVLDRIQPEGGFAIDRAVCLGSGSFSRDNLECRRRSMWQFVVFADLTSEVLKRSSSSSVEMLAQEPEFTDVDKDFLSAVNCQMLRPDKAGDGLDMVKEHIGPSTFIFEPFMDMNETMMDILVMADVALYVGSSVKGLMGRSGVVGELARGFDKQHSKFRVPTFEEDPNVLEGLEMYWKDEIED